MARTRKYRRCRSKRCQALREQLRIALDQKTALRKLVENAEQKQRRAESVLLGYKTVVLEAMRH